MVGVPFPETFDNVTFDKYRPYDNHHISPTHSLRHQTYIGNYKVDKSDIQELEFLGSLTMDTCYLFHFVGKNSPHLNVTPYHPVYSNMTWCGQTKLLRYDEPPTDCLNKLPIRFLKEFGSSVETGLGKVFPQNQMVALVPWDNLQ